MGSSRSALSTLGACLALAAFVMAPATAVGQPPVLDSGPLPVRDRFVLGLGVLVFEPAAPNVLERGRWRVGAATSLTNSWSYSDAVRRSLEAREGRAPLTLDELRAIEPRGGQRALFHADGEIHALEISLHRGLGHGLELRIQTALVEASGGFGDSLVEDFHSLVGVGQAFRDRSIRGDYVAYLRSPDGAELFRDESSGLHASDLLVAVKKRLPGRRGRWAHAVEATVELPTGSESALTGSGSLDFGLRYLGEIRLRRARLRSALGAVRHGGVDLAGLDPETVFSLWLGYERALGARFSILLGASVAESWFKSYGAGRLEDQIVLADLGMKYARGHGTLFGALTQNLNRGASSDIGFHFGWVRDF